MFEKKSLEEFFEKINGAAESNLTLYLIGGGNMSLRNMKVTTKDVDLVLLNRGEIDILKAAIEKLGYSVDKELFQEAVYQDAVIVFKDDSGSRIDIFLKSVCNQLELSERMIKRSSLHKDYGRVKVMLVATEDIFLFKSLTDRPQDIDDGFAFIDAGIDWETIIQECVAQHRKNVKWIFWLYEQLCRIEESKEITIPEKARVFDVCRDSWKKKPSDFMLEFLEEQIKKHVPMPERKEVLKALNESKRRS